MKQRRLVTLLVVMIALLALRWWMPPAKEASVEVAAAVVRTTASAPVATVLAAPAVADADSADLSAGTRELDVTEPRNAFAVRLPPPPPPPPPVPPPVRVTAPKPFVGPPAPVPEQPPPPPPPPPFQVIGSWRDEGGVSLFVAGPRGVQQARVGDVLAEYRFAQITPSRVMLKHLPSNRDVPLVVPAGAGSSLTPK